MEVGVMSYVFLSLVTIVFNIPFGYWRQQTKKFSLLWFVYIHAPVPFVIWMRHLFGIELSFATAPLLFGSYFMGQFIGKKLKAKIMANAAVA